MKINRAGIELIKRFEGCRLTAYRDAVGVLTIGYGITSAAGLGDIREGMTITQAQADDMLVAALVKYEAAVTRHLLRVPNENQFSAMVSLCFNIGEGNFKASSVVPYFNAGNITPAADAFRMWRKAGGKVMQGLVNRREAERALFLTPVTRTEPPVLSDFAPPENPSTSKGIFSMTAEQIGAMVRTVIQLVAGLAIAKGIGNNEMWMAIGSGVASIASGIWSFVWIKKAST